MNICANLSHKRWNGFVCFALFCIEFYQFQSKLCMSSLNSLKVCFRSNDDKFFMYKLFCVEDARFVDLLVKSQTKPTHFYLKLFRMKFIKQMRINHNMSDSSSKRMLINFLYFEFYANYQTKDIF